MLAVEQFIAELWWKNINDRNLSEKNTFYSCWFTDSQRQDDYLLTKLQPLGPGDLEDQVLTLNHSVHGLSPDGDCFK